MDLMVKREKKRATAMSCRCFSLDPYLYLCFVGQLIDSILLCFALPLGGARQHSMNMQVPRISITLFVARSM